MMNDAVFVPAFAKINLHLRVLGKRTDGFHEIESVFQKISIADALVVNLCDHGFEVFSPEFELPKDNTLCKAFDVFRRAVGFDFGAEVRLLKRIPVGAGLGGGSSDAVALLTALNELTRANLSKEKMLKLALEVGSDCPFFLGEAVSIVSGRGEVFETIPARSDCFGVLIFPEVFSSTAVAYKALNCHHKMLERNSQRFIADHYRVDISEWKFVNDFEKVIFDEHRVVATAKNELLNAGADFALMSGSGSSVFGLFKSAEVAKRARVDLQKRWTVCESFLLLT